MNGKGMKNLTVKLSKVGNNVYNIDIEKVMK